MRWKGKEKGFTLIELTIVLAVISIVLGAFITVYKRITPVRASEIMSVMSLTINAIQNYFSDNGRYPDFLGELQRGPYNYLPDMVLDVPNVLIYKGVTIIYNTNETSCGRTPAVAVSFGQDQEDIYNEIKLTVQNGPGWRTDDTTRSVTYCLVRF